MVRILSVSYDPTVVTTRELLLQQMGHTVTSVEGFARALTFSCLGSCGFGKSGSYGTNPFEIRVASAIMKPVPVERFVDKSSRLGEIAANSLSSMLPLHSSRFGGPYPPMAWRESYMYNSAMSNTGGLGTFPGIRTVWPANRDPRRRTWTIVFFWQAQSLPFWAFVLTRCLSSRPGRRSTLQPDRILRRQALQWT